MVRRLDDSRSYPAVGTLLGEAAAWSDGLSPGELADAFRSALSEAYAEASDAEVSDALENVLDSMSAAEGFSLGSALSGIVKSASKVVSDPVFGQIVRTAAPIAGGAVGTLFGGPLGGALGSQLGNLAAQALPAPAAPPAPAARLPAVPLPAVPLPAAPPALRIPQALAAPGPVPSAPPSPVAGGSAAAAQGLVLTQQPELLRSLLSVALGQQGRPTVSGLPVAQILRMFGEVIEQAAADADELMYLGQGPGAAESAAEAASPGSARSLYVDLLGADNLEFAEAAGWEALD
jgi:hypothetical protein